MSRWVGGWWSVGWWIGSRGGSVEDLLVSRWSLVGGRWVGGGSVDESVDRWSTCRWVGRALVSGLVVGCRWPVENLSVLEGRLSVVGGLLGVNGFVIRSSRTIFQKSFLTNLSSYPSKRGAASTKTNLNYNKYNFSILKY